MASSLMGSPMCVTAGELVAVDAVAVARMAVVAEVAFKEAKDLTFWGDMEWRVYEFSWPSISVWHCRCQSFFSSQANVIIATSAVITTSTVSNVAFHTHRNLCAEFCKYLCRTNSVYAETAHSLCTLKWIHLVQALTLEAVLYLKCTLSVFCWWLFLWKHFLLLILYPHNHCSALCSLVLRGGYSMFWSSWFLHWEIYLSFYLKSQLYQQIPVYLQIPLYLEATLFHEDSTLYEDSTLFADSTLSRCSTLSEDFTLSGNFTFSGDSTLSADSTLSVKRH